MTQTIYIMWLAFLNYYVPIIISQTLSLSLILHFIFFLSSAVILFYYGRDKKEIWTAKLVVSARFKPEAYKKKDKWLFLINLTRQFKKVLKRWHALRRSKGFRTMNVWILVKLACKSHVSCIYRSRYHKHGCINFSNVYID